MNTEYSVRLNVDDRRSELLSSGSFDAAAAAAKAGCNVTLRLDSQDGPVIGTAIIKSTGSVEKYKSFSAKVKDAAGVHDLYLCFEKTQGDTRLDWWEFR